MGAHRMRSRECAPQHRGGVREALALVQGERAFVADL
jgi:hypothetical protein